MNLIEKLRKNKIKLLIILLFLVSVTLNFFYGSILYSKVFGKQPQYTIGKECVQSRTECEKKYFQSYLDKINSLANEDRTYFSGIIIKNDQIEYTGNCPCPYDSDSRGSSCGGRSSYSKKGQISYCYDSDVTDSQIADKKASMMAQANNELDNSVQKEVNVYHEHYTLLFLIIVFCGLFFYFRDKKVNLA